MNIIAEVGLLVRNPVENAEFTSTIIGWRSQTGVGLDRDRAALLVQCKVDRAVPKLELVWLFVLEVLLNFFDALWIYCFVQGFPEASLALDNGHFPVP